MTGTDVGVCVPVTGVDVDVSGADVVSAGWMVASGSEVPFAEVKLQADSRDMAVMENMNARYMLFAPWVCGHSAFCN